MKNLIARELFTKYIFFPLDYTCYQLYTNREKMAVCHIRMLNSAIKLFMRSSGNPLKFIMKYYVYIHDKPRSEFKVIMNPFVESSNN